MVVCQPLPGLAVYPLSCGLVDVVAAAGDHLSKACCPRTKDGRLPAKTRSRKKQSLNTSA